MGEAGGRAPFAVVVDDDFLIRMDAMEILGEAGFRVLDAEHGDAALDLLAGRHPDVALLFTDVQMPGTLDGFGLARLVAESWPHIAIVVASGTMRPSAGDIPDKARFIPKPFSAEIVRAHVSEILPNRQKPQPLR